MRREDPNSPLPHDPPGREDIVSDEPGEEEAGPGAGTGSPLPPDPAGREDIIQAGQQDQAPGR